MSALFSRSLRSALRPSTRISSPASHFSRQFRTSSPKMVVHSIQSETEWEALLKLEDTKGNPLQSKDSNGNVLANQQTVFVDFYADWCGPCRAIAPMIDKASEVEANQHIRFVKVNVDHQPVISEKFEITAMPSFLFFEKGTGNEVTEKGLSRRKISKKIRGADIKELQSSIPQFAASAKAAAEVAASQEGSA